MTRGHHLLLLSLAAPAPACRAATAAAEAPSAGATPWNRLITLDPSGTDQTIVSWDAVAQAGRDSPDFPRGRGQIVAQAVDSLGVNRIWLEVRSGVENGFTDPVAIAGFRESPGLPTRAPPPGRAIEAEAGWPPGEADPVREQGQSGRVPRGAHAVAPRTAEVRPGVGRRGAPERAAAVSSHSPAPVRDWPRTGGFRGVEARTWRGKGL